MFSSSFNYYHIEVCCTHYWSNAFIQVLILSLLINIHVLANSLLFRLWFWNWK